MKTVTAIKLTQEGAMTVLRGALDKAASLGVAAAVAVVDEGGHLFAFGRSEKLSFTQSPSHRLRRGARL